MFSNDPIWRFLNRFLNLNSRMKSLLFGIGVGSFTFLIIPFFTGYLFPRSDGLSSFEDWPGLIITFVTHPAIYLYYCFEQERIFIRLQKDLSIFHKIANFESFDNHLRKALNSKKLVLLAMLLTFVGYLLHIQAVLSHPTFSYYYPNKFILFFVNAPLSSLVGYMISLVAIRYLIMVFFLFRFYNDYKPKIHPFHPDGCGGLSFIGKFVMRSFVLVAIMAIDISLLVVINLWQTNRDPLTEPSFLSIFIIYLLLFPLSIIVPLLSSTVHVHRIKQNWKRLIEIEFQVDKIPSMEMDSLSSYADKLILNRNIYNLLSELSVIPIDKRTLARIALLMLVSLVPILSLFLLRTMLHIS